MSSTSNDKKKEWLYPEEEALNQNCHSRLFFVSTFHHIASGTHVVTAFFPDKTVEKSSMHSSMSAESTQRRTADHRLLSKKFSHDYRSSTMTTHSNDLSECLRDDFFFNRSIWLGAGWYKILTCRSGLWVIPTDRIVTDNQSHVAPTISGKHQRLPRALFKYHSPVSLLPNRNTLVRQVRSTLQF